MSFAILRRWPRAVWQFIRALSRDDAYSAYLRHHEAAHAGTPPLSAREFYLREQERKWSGISRCC
jgi:uncharacterized short protein YbdD (DUF466 family)